MRRKPGYTRVYQGASLPCTKSLVQSLVSLVYPGGTRLTRLLAKKTCWQKVWLVWFNQTFMVNLVQLHKTEVLPTIVNTDSGKFTVLLKTTISSGMLSV